MRIFGAHFFAAACVAGLLAAGGHARAQAEDGSGLDDAPGFVDRLGGAWGSAVGELFGGAEPDAEASAPARIDPRAARIAELDAAFADLRSEEEAVWREAEETILELQSRSGSASFDLLLSRGRSAVERQDLDAAVEHLTDLVNLEPNFAEGWHARAVAHYLNGDIGPALDDLADALAREPRHFTALAGLATVLEELGDVDRALDAYRLAKELHPNLAGVDDAIDRLASDVDGVPI